MLANSNVCDSSCLVKNRSINARPNTYGFFAGIKDICSIDLYMPCWECVLHVCRGTDHIFTDFRCCFLRWHLYFYLLEAAGKKSCVNPSLDSVAVSNAAVSLDVVIPELLLLVSVDVINLAVSLDVAISELLSHSSNFSETILWMLHYSSNLPSIFSIIP